MDKVEFINRLKAAYLSCPYDRFGQFFFNCFVDIELIYNMTDEEMIIIIEDYVANLGNMGG